MKQFLSALLLLLLINPRGTKADRNQLLGEWASIRDEDVGNTHERDVIRFLSGNRKQRSLEKEFKEIEDYEITNDSNEVKDTISILSHSFKMKPVPSSLTKGQLSKIKTVTEALFLDYFPPNIKSVRLDDIEEYDWKESQRMLRSGRYLADGASTEPTSFLTFEGGEVNTTLDLYYIDPTEEELNIWVENVLSLYLLDELKKEDDFKQLTDLEIVYRQPKVIGGAPMAPTNPPSESRDIIGVPVRRTYWLVLGSGIVALGAAMYGRRRLQSQREQENNDLRERSQLRSRSVEPHNVEYEERSIGSDNVEGHNNWFCWY